MADALIEIDRQGDGIRLFGYLGKPSVNRSNRNYELYFLNGRFIKSTLVSRAVEEGYKSYLMQHKYPFCVLMMEVEPSRVDVNVHPAKMEVRFTEEMRVYGFLAESVKEVLDAHEMIPEIVLTEPEKEETKEKALEPFQKMRREIREESIKSILPVMAEEKEQQEIISKDLKPKVTSKDFFVDFEDEEDTEEVENTGISKEGSYEEHVDRGKWFLSENAIEKSINEMESLEEPEKDLRFIEFQKADSGIVSEENAAYYIKGENPVISQAEQLNLFEEKIISETSRKKFRILGQVFDTYWIVVFEDKLLMIDQHAAHEKVKFERIMKAVRESEVLSQNLYPPLVLSLSGREQEILARYQDAFTKLGFELEYFGGNEITVRSAPVELFGSTIKDMFLEVLDELSTTGIGRAKSVEERIATMACKAAVKGNMGMSVPEMEALLDELLTLDNPYFCPHGRPTIISFTKQELEKKFKRIVS